MINRLCFILALTALAMLAPTANAQPEPDRVVTYKTIDDIDLELFVFEPGGNDATRPAVVFFHGGGWNGGEPTQFFRQAQHIASRSGVGISVRYRLKSTHGTSPFDAIRDAFDAMRFVRDNADDFNIDPQRIAAAGGSAGGHLAAATATLTAPDLAGEADDAARARPNALVLFNAVSDNGPDGWANNRLGDRWQDASPAHNLSKDVPPTLHLIGDSDNLIPVDTAERMIGDLQDLGVDARLVVYPDAGHGFFNRDSGTPNFFRGTVADMDAFLVELGWLVPQEAE
ncbi:MAG: alpha/beta hydrolase [Planctomycetota bacterium]